MKTAGGAQPFAGSASCAATPTLTCSSLTNTFTCSNIAGLDAAVITTGTIAAARLPADASAWTVSGGNAYRATGNVGIGTATPGSLLDVVNQTASSASTIRAINTNYHSGISIDS